MWNDTEPGTPKMQKIRKNKDKNRFVALDLKKMI